MPLTYVAYEVVLLRRWLPSPAWTYIMVGILAFLAITVFIIVGQWPASPFRAGAYLLVCTCIAIGFRKLRLDVAELAGKRRTKAGVFEDRGREEPVAESKPEPGEKE